MGRSAPVRAKTPAPQIGTPTNSLQRSHGPQPFEEESENAPDIATQMDHALQFGHSFGQSGAVQRQAEEEEIDRKPEEDELQRQAAEEEDEIQPRLSVAALQREPLQEEEDVQRQPKEEEDGLQRRSLSVQPKLTIGQPGDRYEQEADRTAARVMAISEPKQDEANLQQRLDVSSLQKGSVQREEKAKNRSFWDNQKVEFGVGLVETPKFDSPIPGAVRNYSDGNIPGFLLNKGVGLRFSKKGIEPIAINKFGENPMWETYSYKEIKEKISGLGKSAKGTSPKQSSLGFSPNQNPQFPPLSGLPPSLYDPAKLESTLAPSNISGFQLEQGDPVSDLFPPPSLLSPEELQLD